MKRKLTIKWEKMFKQLIYSGVFLYFIKKLVGDECRNN